MACTAGWHKDLLHTAPGAPCVLTTAWLKGVLTASLVMIPLAFCSTMAVIVMLRRAGEPWLSLRMKVYAVMGFVIFPLQILYVTLLLSDLDAGLADRSAAWRVTKLVHWFCYSAHWPFGCWMLFMPAARFLQALDVGLFQPTRQRFKLMLVRGTASLMVCGVGIGVALFSTSESTQDAMGALVLVAYGGSIAPVVPEGVRTFRLLKQLLARLA